MRVIAGEFRSRRLKSIPGDATRPTPDRLREALFDILQTRIEGATFVDAYAGTGAVGIEALSRGAAHATFLEKDRVAVDTIRENLAALKVERRATVVKGAVLKTIALWPAEIIFLDPPYSLEGEYTAALELLSERPPALTVVQHSARLALADSYGNLHRTRLVKQGDNALSFYTAVKIEPAPEASGEMPPAPTSPTTKPHRGRNPQSTKAIRATMPYSPPATSTWLRPPPFSSLPGE